MAVTILPLPRQYALKVDGDIGAMLRIPAWPPARADDGEEFVDIYYISLSDGSLIQASFHDEPEFHVVVEGAGCVKIDEGGKSLFVDWQIDWINLAPGRSAIGLARWVPGSMPLFEHLAPAM